MGAHKKAWCICQWLHDELERDVAGRAPYNSGNSGGYYSNWSPPAASNETANGYFLERSHSARLTLEKAFELLPEDEEEEGDGGAGGGPGGEEDPAPPNLNKKPGGGTLPRPADR